VTTTALLGFDNVRRSITWVRPGLSGYQSSACFYCGAPVTPLLDLEHSADVDHYFAHSLMARGVFIYLDNVWNLVLAVRGLQPGIGWEVPSAPARGFPRTALETQRNPHLQPPPAARGRHHGDRQDVGSPARLPTVGSNPRRRIRPC
jgi:HNH endonuclease